MVSNPPIGSTPPAPAAERLRVLVVDEAPPFPPDSGKRLRTWHLLRRLARWHDVVLLSYAAADPGAQTEAQAALAAAGIECHAVPPPAAAAGPRLYARLLANCFSPWPYSVAKHRSRRFRRALSALARERAFDLVQIEWTPYAVHLGAGGPPHLIASHNIETQIWRRRARISGNALARLFFNWQAAKMERFERRAFRRARAVTVVSADDRALARRMGAVRSRIVANGVDLDEFHPRPGQVPDRLLFLGALDWYPNQDAVTWFVEAMLPLILARRPGARFQVAGRRPPAALRRRLRAAPGVEMVGEVADVRPLLAAAAVVVVPLRVGGGSRIKIIEALAMERAVVSTSVGAEGLDLQPGTHLLIADTPQQFARLTLQLLTTPGQGRHLGEAGGAWVRAHHGWDESARALEAEWRLAARPAPAPVSRAALSEVGTCR